MKNSILHFMLPAAGLLLPLAMHADTFTGRVLDENGEPLAGAVIKVSGSKTPYVTDTEGHYHFSLPGESVAKVEVNYVGYVPLSQVLKSRGAKGETLRMSPDNAALSEVVVTATRTPKALKDVPVVTRLITADDIAKTDATNIQDLLTEELPGLEFGYAMSQETSLNVNGFGGSAVLFLVDGERLAGETMDNVDYNRLNLDNVGQVEVVKGASSALYGANAVGGVVNLITKENKEPWHVNLNTRYRSMGDEWRSGGDISFNSGKWNSNTSVQYTTMKTVKLTSAFDTESSLHEIYGGNSLNVKERLSFRPRENVQLIARGAYFQRESNRGNYDDHYKDYSAGLRGIIDFTPHNNLEVSYSYDQYDKARYIGGVRTHVHDYTNRQNILHALYTHFWGVNGLTVGADFMHDYLTTYQFKDNADHSQNTFDAFVQFDYNPLSWLNVIASVREDYFSASKNNAVTARLATMFKLKPMTIRLSYSGGFRAPTLKEMYMSFDMAGIQMIYGNPDLKPERSQNFNFALERSGRVDGLLGGAYNATFSSAYSYYNRRITTEDWPGENGEPGSRYANEDGVKVTTLDLNLRYRFNMGLSLSASGNYLHIAGRSIDSQFGAPRPWSATWRIDYDRQLCSFYKLYAGISGRYLAKAESDYATGGAYSMWKFTLQNRLFKSVNLNFTVDNLLDYKPEIYYWNSPVTTGRTWSIGVTVDVNDLFK